MESKVEPIRMFLCGDVMTGRGIDQVLPHPGNPVLYEPCVRDARDYVELAECVNGAIQRPVRFKYIWGDALTELSRVRADLKIVNLETSITSNGKPWPGKGIHYRMHPNNIGCLTVAGINACSLANNHVLDWGYKGLEETLQALNGAGIAHSGAGCNAIEAAAPAMVEVPGKGRVLLFSFGSCTSGIPLEWGASQSRPGVNLLEDLSEATVRCLARCMRQLKQSGDVAIASIHWGGNWGYGVPKEQTFFAHLLIEEGFDIVYGHSSHHVKAIEVYQDRLILYGCGDFINDYEGIRGYEEFRGDQSLMYLVTVDTHGRLLGAQLVPMQMRRFQLHHASAADAAWLCALLNRLGAPFSTQLQLAEDNCLRVII